MLVFWRNVDRYFQYSLLRVGFHVLYWTNGEKIDTAQGFCWNNNKKAHVSAVEMVMGNKNTVCCCFSKAALCILDGGREGGSR